MKKQYYDIKNLIATKAQYMILLGQRSNGKSYQVKKTVLEDAYNNKQCFVYLRRWVADIKVNAVEAYFGDINIKELPRGDWDSVKAWNGFIFFARTSEKGKIEKSEPIGRYCALNELERYKSWVFENYKYIVYEEFITDKIYLDDEPRQLQQFVSTVARDREMTVFMVGNTLSRVCPYFNEWCLEGVLKQKQGTIEIYHHHIGDDVINIAVEYCNTVNYKNTMFFGQSAKQIISGEWDTVEVPKLPKPRNKYEKVYELLLSYQSFKFVIELLIEPEDGGRICHVYPLTTGREPDRIITDVFSDKPNITRKLDINRKPEFLIMECFRMEKVCYANNLTGADLRNIISKFKFY